MNNEIVSNKIIPKEVELLVELKYYPEERSIAWVKSLPREVIEKVYKDYDPFSPEEGEIGFETKVTIIQFFMGYYKDEGEVQKMIRKELIMYEHRRSTL